MRYCKACGHHISFGNGEKMSYCPICDREVEYSKDTIGTHSLRSRISQLKAMHQLICEANDEDIYFSWIATFPDEPSDEDFYDVAMDDEAYNECFDEFVKLVADEGNRY